MRRLYFLAIALISCESFDYRISSEFKPYIEKFYEYAKQSGVAISKENLVVKFRQGLTVDKGYTAYAICPKYGESQRFIYVDVDAWESSSEELRELIIIHECGHIFLCRSHDDNGMKVMNSTPREQDWTQHKEELVKELFSKRECN